MAPLLYYGYPDWLPMTLRIHMYIIEKKLPESVIVSVKSDEDAKAKGYPAKSDGVWCPVMAVPKPNTEPVEYTWIEQSLAILEFLEDHCDAHPEVTSVGSLRGGADLIKRAEIRAMMLWADEAFYLFAFSVMYGNQHFAQKYKRVELNGHVAKELASNANFRALKPLDDHAASGVINFDALARGEDGAATLADITMYASWYYALDFYHVDYAKTFPNLNKWMEAFGKRVSAKRESFSPDLPDKTEHGTTWAKGVWDDNVGVPYKKIRYTG